MLTAFTACGCRISHNDGMKILLVEDEVKIAEFVSEGLNFGFDFIKLIASSISLKGCL